jgi:hypothetical protein
MLQVFAVDATWLLNTATSGGAAHMYEFSRLTMRNNTLQHNTGNHQGLTRSGRVSKLS